VHLTDQEIKYINAIWSKVDYKQVGGEALARLLIVYPWTQRYFSTFGNLASADAISHNSKVIAHGEKVLRSIGEALKHLDNLKGYAKLSQYHSEKLHVDPANFVRFGGVVVIVLAHHFHEEFTPEVQAAFEKAFGGVADAVGKGYH
uniref:Hemoglobin subunit beta-2 n=1 Tax=Telmatobius peruvianus TaxID=170953 RepID=HBB2_TELPE|nr:RecName: Full=Hemoglobin subunit beta-2; AltName: Full=Beta-2-globin; AltName: Full=Hemoglobin beta-2 chain [Telmatobius peruvianus]